MTDGGGLYLGIDVGTSATRVSLVRPDGGARTASASYPTTRTSDGAVEQDPVAWTRALAAALRRTSTDLSAVTAVGSAGRRPRWWSG